MSAPTGLAPDTVLRNYFHAKDENRPHLLERVFEPSAELVVVNHADTISFPARTVGREGVPVEPPNEPSERIARDTVGGHGAPP